MYQGEGWQLDSNLILLSNESEEKQMKFYGATFFADVVDKIGASIRIDLKDTSWPVTIKLFNKKRPYTDDVTFHLSEENLINLKNDIISCYESYLCAKKEAANG